LLEKYNFSYKLLLFLFKLEACSNYHDTNSAPARIVPTFEKTHYMFQHQMKPCSASCALLETDRWNVICIDAISC